MATTVAFIYGFTEGEWHGKRFRKVLRENGYEIVYNPHVADIIIAHSGGCYHVPIDLKPSQKVLLINPTYWPGKPLLLRALKMFGQLITAVRIGNRPLYQLQKTVHNLWYLVWHADTNRDMVKRAHKFELPVEIKHNPTTLVRNLHDPWLTPKLDDLKQINPQLRIVCMPGWHDHCWEFPEAYLHLLQS